MLRYAPGSPYVTLNASVDFGAARDYLARLNGGEHVSVSSPVQSNHQGNLRAKRHDSQEREAQLGCAILNKLRALGAPSSVRAE